MTLPTFQRLPEDAICLGWRGDDPQLVTLDSASERGEPHVEDHGLSSGVQT